MTVKSVFITGTDTGIGKTYSTLSLMAMLKRTGLKVVGMKPVSTGAVRHSGRLLNEDALAIQQAGSIDLPYEAINPYVFEQEVSPHIAFSDEGRYLDIDKIKEAHNYLCGLADCVLVEGVGGWLTPLTDRMAVSDLAREMQLPILLVVGLKLGCINHARLTASAIRDRGSTLLGWSACSLVNGLSREKEVIEAITEHLQSLPLMQLPFISDPFSVQSIDACDAEASSILRLIAP
jgi:dethiobiotin synthetase